MEATTYKITHLKGTIGDLAREWMTDEDWDSYNSYVEELKASGEYLQPEEITMTLVDNPQYDTPELFSATESARMEFLDFGETTFHGISYTLQDGSSLTATPHPEVKQQIEDALNTPRRS